MSPTVAIVLAAGVGSRLRPLTDTQPKCLLDVGGETILHRMVRLLREAGVARVIVSTGYLAANVRNAMAGMNIASVCVDNPDHATTQNVVSLARALDVLQPGEAFVKFDGDVVFDAPVLASLLAPDVPRWPVPRSTGRTRHATKR